MQGIAGKFFLLCRASCREQILICPATPDPRCIPQIPPHNTLHNSRVPGSSAQWLHWHPGCWTWGSKSWSPVSRGLSRCQGDSALPSPAGSRSSRNHCSGRGGPDGSPETGEREINVHVENDGYYSNTNMSISKKERLTEYQLLIRKETLPMILVKTSAKFLSKSKVGILSYARANWEAPSSWVYLSI